MISLADAKWSFTGTEVGDLSFTAGDVIEVLEKIKEDWWKGRVRGGKGDIGLFPSSYVSETVVLAKEKAPLPSLPPRTQAGYGPGGNMMTDVAHGSNDAEKKQGALAKNGEKFGKKLGNATIFGAVSFSLPTSASVALIGVAIGRNTWRQDCQWSFLKLPIFAFPTFFVSSYPLIQHTHA